MPGLLDVVQLRTAGVDLDQDNVTASDRERREELIQRQRLPGPAVAEQAVLSYHGAHGTTWLKGLPGAAGGTLLPHRPRSCSQHAGIIRGVFSEVLLGGKRTLTAGSSNSKD